VYYIIKLGLGASGGIMDEKDREDLLIRIDERTTFLSRDLKNLASAMNTKLDVIREQQETQNDSIEAALILATTNQTSIKWIKVIAGSISAALLSLIGFFIKYIFVLVDQAKINR